MISSANSFKADWNIPTLDERKAQVAEKRKKAEEKSQPQLQPAKAKILYKDDFEVRGLE